jgi:uncharacterized protein YkwD
MTGLRGTVAGAAAVIAVALAIALSAPAGAATGSDSCRAQDEQILEEADIELAERSLLCLLNVHRVAEGQAPLPWEPDLAASAREHSEDMVARQFLEHDNPDGESPTDRAKRHGYSGFVRENINDRGVAASVTPADFFRAWQEDSLNDELMLSANFKVVGSGFAIGTHTGDPGVTATQAFGREKTASAAYTGLDMLIPARCPRARKALRKAKQKLATAKEAGVGIAAAKLKVKKRKAAVRRACNPTRF